MRISDWSSDVCSSDLHDLARRAYAGCRHGDEPALGLLPRRRTQPQGSAEPDGLLIGGIRPVAVIGDENPSPEGEGFNRVATRAQDPYADIDRKSVVKGKRVSVRVDLGGRRIIKKKNNNKISSIS